MGEIFFKKKPLKKIKYWAVEIFWTCGSNLLCSMEVECVWLLGGNLGVPMGKPSFQFSNICWGFRGVLSPLKCIWVVEKSKDAIGKYTKVCDKWHKNTTSIFNNNLANNLQERKISMKRHCIPKQRSILKSKST